MDPNQSSPPATEAELPKIVNPAADVDYMTAILSTATESSWRDALKDVSLLSEGELPEIKKVSPDVIQSLGKQLTLRLAKAIKDNEVAIREVPEISGYILSKLEKIETDSDITDLLYLLTEEWPWFSTVRQEVAISSKDSSRDQIAAIAGSNTE